MDKNINENINYLVKELTTTRKELDGLKVSYEALRREYEIEKLHINNMLTAIIHYKRALREIVKDIAISCNVAVFRVDDELEDLLMQIKSEFDAEDEE